MTSWRTELEGIGAWRRAGDTDTRYITEIGETTRPPRGPSDQGHALRWELAGILLKIVTWATTPRMHSTPYGSGGPVDVNMVLEPQSPGASTVATAATGAEGRDLLDMSPAKKGRTEGQPPQGGITLEALRDLFRGELSIAVGQVNSRVGALEQTVQTQLAEHTLKLCEITTEVEGHKTKMDQVQDKLETLETRLTKLENSEPSGEEQVKGRAPAMIMGGFHPDTEASKVIDQATKLVDTLRLDLDVQDAFVPGLRRGYCIIPLHKKGGETDDQQRTRVQACIRQVRNANVTVGTRPDGAPAKLFLNISQPPEKRRKVQVAAKCKRLLMDPGALAADVEAEYSTGQVWHKSVKVASASNNMAPISSVTTGTGGWIDLHTIANNIHRSVDAVQAAWQPLGAVLK